MDIYDSELQRHVLWKMREEGIRNFSEEELERVFADFDLLEETYLDIVASLIDEGLTIDNLYFW